MKTPQTAVEKSLRVWFGVKSSTRLSGCLSLHIIKRLSQAAENTVAC